MQTSRSFITELKLSRKHLLLGLGLIALLLLLYREPLWVLPTREIGIVLLYVAALLTLLGYIPGIIHAIWVIIKK